MSRLPILRTASLATAMLLCASAQAAPPETCGDINSWAVSPPRDQKPLNSPGASKPSNGDSLGIEVERAKLKSFLTCDIKLLPTSAALSAWSANAQASTVATTRTKAFYAVVASALASGKNSRGAVIDRNSLAQAVYLQKLASAHYRLGGTNEGNADWRKRQQVAWCEGKDTSTALSTKLPSIDEGVASLDTYAIKLAWEGAGSWTTEQLGFGCNAALREVGK